MFSPSHPHTLPRTSSTDHYLPTFDLSLPVQITTNCAGFISCFSTLIWGWRDLVHSKATVLPGYEKDLPSGPGLSQELSSLHWEILDQQPLPNRPGPQLWDTQPDKTTLPSGGLGQWPVDPMSIEEWGSHSLPGSQPTPFPNPQLLAGPLQKHLAAEKAQALRLLEDKVWNHTLGHLYFPSQPCGYPFTPHVWFLLFLFSQAVFLNRDVPIIEKTFSKMNTHSTEPLRPGRATWAADLTQGERTDAFGTATGRAGGHLLREGDSGRDCQGPFLRWMYWVADTLGAPLCPRENKPQEVNSSLLPSVLTCRMWGGSYPSALLAFRFPVVQTVHGHSCHLLCGWNLNVLPTC